MAAPLSEASIKEKIREYLNLTLPECFVPELGESKKGKVRDIYFSGENVVMVTNDRVSAFDYILPNLIPFKGQVLNMISAWAFSKTKDIVPNALIENIDASVVVQKKMKNLNVELIVRGYLWGSMAAAYEKGDRTFCGLPVPEGLNRFQKFDTPIFTPTTKAEVGHDLNMTLDDMEKLLGKELAQKAKTVALKLYERGSELLKKQGLVLIDTKYEFGVDENGVLHVIDEVNTPDSSRMCTIEEWESKYPKIAAEMETKKYKNVTDVLKAHPELKMKEFSKQYVRDALLELGFNPEKDKEAPKLSEEQVVECAYRYIKTYEQVTGETFAFPPIKIPAAERVVMNLKAAGVIKGCFVVIVAGSDSDLPHLETLQTALSKFKIPSQIRICSAQKQPALLQSIIEEYNKSAEPILIVSCAGSTDALSGIASYLSRHPVVSCLPDGTNSCLSNPTGSSNAYILQPENVAKFAAQVFSHVNEEIAAALDASVKENIVRLEEADASLMKKARHG